MRPRLRDLSGRLEELGIELRIPGYKASGLSTTTQWLYMVMDINGSTSTSNC